MAFSPVAFIAPNYRDYKNYWLKFYESGTTTPKPIALEADGGTQVAKLQLSADGFIISAGEAIVMPYIDGYYDAYLFPTAAEADANDTINAIRVADNLISKGTDEIKEIIAGQNPVFSFSTLEDALNSNDEDIIYEGAALNIKENSTGSGLGSMWDVTSNASVTEDGEDIFTSSGIPTLALVKREDTRVDKRIDDLDVSNDYSANISKPPNFPLELDYNVIKNQNGFTTDFDFKAQRQSIPKVYVDYENGSDGNDGSYLLPYKTISAAIASEAGPVELLMYPSLHRADSAPSLVINKDFNMVALDPLNRPRVTNTEEATWIKTGGFTNVYEATMATAPLPNSFDSFGAGENGVYTRLSVQASIADVDANQGSLFISGNIIYVHTSNSRAADNLVMVHVATELITVTGSNKAYLENIKFEGGLDGCFKSIGTDGEHETYAVGCTFGYSNSGEGGVKAVGFGKFYSKNCTAVLNNQDGFNYKWDGISANGTFLEDNCVGVLNGELNGSNDQGSTSHDGINGVRVGCTYVDNASSGIGDITAGTQTWNVGCWAGSNSTVLSASNVCYVAFTDAVVYLDYCQSNSGRYSMFADAGAEILVRGGQFDRAPLPGAGTLTSRDDAERDVFQGSLGDYYVGRDLIVMRNITAQIFTQTADTTWFHTMDRTANGIIDQLAGVGVSGADAANNTMVFGNAVGQWMTLGLSPANQGDLTITGSYSPFTGVHLFKSSSEIDTGLAVDLINAEREQIGGSWIDGEVALCNTPASKICAGIVEKSQLINGVWINAVAATGDNRTSKLDGFRISQPVTAGDILVTDTGGLLMVSDGTEPQEVVKFKAMQTQADISLPVYGYFI